MSASADDDRAQRKSTLTERTWVPLGMAVTVAGAMITGAAWINSRLDTLKTEATAAQLSTVQSLQQQSTSLRNEQIAAVQALEAQIRELGSKYQTQGEARLQFENLRDKVDLLLRNGEAQGARIVSMESQLAQLRVDLAKVQAKTGDAPNGSGGR